MTDIGCYPGRLPDHLERGCRGRFERPAVVSAWVLTLAPVVRRLLLAAVFAGLAFLAMLAIGAGTASAETGGSFAHCPQLDEGDTGPCVAKLQRMLTKVHPAYALPGSETFGPATRIAVLDFQGRNHLGADGRVGAVTAGELQRQYNAAGGGSVPSPTTGSPLTAQTTPQPSTATGARGGGPAPATGCVGAACTGEDPRGMRCDSDARTVTREDLVVTRSRTASNSTAVTGSGDASASGDATGGAVGGATVVGGAGAAGGRASGEGKLNGSVGVENSEQREYVDLVAGTIEVRYSPNCHAAWAKVTTRSDTPLETLTIKNDSGQSQSTAQDIRLRAAPGKNNESTSAGNYYTKLLAVSDTDQVTALAKGTRGAVDFSPNHNQSAGPVVAAHT